MHRIVVPVGIALTGIALVVAAGALEAQQAGAVRTADAVEVAVVPAGIFHGAGLLVPEADLGAIGEVVDVIGPTAVPRRSPPQIHPYDRVYVRLGARVAPGARLDFYRRGREVVPYGRIFVPTGVGSVLAVDGGIATVEIEGLHDRMEIGDLVVPHVDHEPRPGVTPVAASGLEGSILALASDGPLASREDLVHLDLGEASGVAIGDEFDVVAGPEVESWGIRPEEVVGRVRVVRTTSLTSAAMIVSLRHPAVAPGLRVRLVARMP